ncbi:DUF1642 domain-containing protein [Streptococcus infantis]|uniref:DUF1642 domain-containing protein n=1 Tax=Streptococcus infantis TaxID=68892 RepID=UPI001CBB3B98|nr:DUF1642 domain-containing protein [Streptococcus infantis]MBZ2109908.1 DUF1642 domain-containing protein [Streptococcus infantis]MBZ2111756.1 DUF1642 domain-containing protein [Streptococcus infantis]
MNKQELRTNKQELISKYELLKNSYNFKVVATDGIISDLKRLDEPETGHADEAPRYVKNILARLRELPLHDREVWLKAIMGEFEQDFSHAKWREGYEVEEEKRYLVKVKGIDTNFNFLNCHRNENYWIFSSKDKNTLYQTHHTRKELEEAGFSWVFDCEGIEIEEVE